MKMWVHAPRDTEVFSEAGFRAEEDVKDSRGLLCVTQRFSLHFECTGLC